MHFALNARNQSQYKRTSKTQIHSLPKYCEEIIKINCYYIAEKWENAFALFQEMEMKGIQPDLIACSALMRAFNRGNQPAKVLIISEFMQDRKIPMNDSIYFEIFSACSM